MITEILLAMLVIGIASGIGIALGPPIEETPEEQRRREREERRKNDWPDSHPNWS